MSIKRKKQKKLPWAIYVIAIVLILYSLYLMISGFIGFYSMFSSGGISEQLSESQKEEYKLRFENRGFDYNESTLTVFALFGLIIMTLFEVFFIVVGFGLLARKNWARISAIVIFYLNVLISLIGVFLLDITSFLHLGISLLFGTYLLISPKVKSVFKKI